MTLAEAIQIAGYLSQPNKMPGFAYGTPAANCKLGARLAEVDGSVCSRCYARKGNYARDNVWFRNHQRFKSLKHPLWTPAMIELIRFAARQRSRYFRWHDSGDLQSLRHLSNIVRIAKALPEVRFWLPTQEYGLVKRWRAKHGEFPTNLVVRLSAHMIDKPIVSDLPTSVVHASHAHDPAPGVHYCPASKQFNHCDDCRACWDPNVKLVSYPLH